MNSIQQTDKALEIVKTFIIEKIKEIISHHFATLVIKSGSDEEAKKTLQAMEMLAGIFNGKLVNNNKTLDMNAEDWNLVKSYIEIVNTLEKQYDK